MSTKTRHPFRTELQLMLVVIVWGLNFSVMKIVLSVMHPHVVNVFRMLTAGAALAVLYAVQQRKRGLHFFAPLVSHPREIIRLGFIGWVLYQVAFVVGLNHTTAGSAAIIMTSLPLWTALLAFFMGIERLSKLVWTGLFVSMTGTAIVVLAGNQKIGLGSEFLLGNLIVRDRIHTVVSLYSSEQETRTRNISARSDGSRADRVASIYRTHIPAILERSGVVQDNDQYLATHHFFG